MTAVVRPGRSKETALIRQKLFVERWLTNGNNATEAAAYAGFSEASAHVRGCELLARDDVKAMIGARAERLVRTAELSTERWAKEMAAIGHFDPGELYDVDGNLIPIYQLPEHVRRAIASVKRERRTEGKGETVATVTTEEVKLHDKNTALANIGKHLGVFAEDNRQLNRPIQVLVQLMG